MKFNWGSGIFLFYVVFAGSMFFMVYKSTQYDHSLVTEDYYAKDLAYQKHFVKLQNSMGLEEDLQIQLNRDQAVISFLFPKNLGQIEGEILFFNPISKKKDFSIPISLDQESKLLIPSEKFEKGLWKIKVDWKAGTKPFYKEKSIMI